MRRLHRKISTLLAIAMTFWLSGCYAIMDDWIECENSIVNYYRANKAWGDHKGDLTDLDHKWDVRKGFLDGYQETASSGPGSSYGQCQDEQCLPLMPPRKYWKHCYQDCEGREKIDAWYQGYAFGAMAAAQDGVYASSVIPTYGLYNGMNHPNARHTTSLEEDGMHYEHDQLVPEPDRALPNSNELLPVPDTYDGLPKSPPAEDAPPPEGPVSGASYEYSNDSRSQEWVTRPYAVPAARQVYQKDTRTAPIDRVIPNARFTGVTTEESTSARAQWESAGDFVLPVGYDGFRAPEWSEGANRE